ncbi:MAG: hypothetical protein ACOCP8_08210 [archaeon]
MEIKINIPDKSVETFLKKEGYLVSGNNKEFCRKLIEIGLNNQLCHYSAIDILDDLKGVLEENIV